MNEAAAKQLLDKLYRQQASKLTTSLAAYFKLTSLELAEDIVQDTFEAALQHWGKTTIPQDPLAWLYQVCRNKALNKLSGQSKTTTVGTVSATQSQLPPELFLEHELPESRLRLLFSLCHPKLSPKAQLLLILRYICNLKTEEIGTAMVMGTEAVLKMLQRSRQVLQQEQQPVLVPSLAKSKSYLPQVLTAIYLLYNEGYKSSSGDALLRQELCQEAIKLLHSLLHLPVLATPAAHALMALLLLNTSRFQARTGAQGDIVELEEQDRKLWDRTLIALGFQHLSIARAGTEISRFHLEAAIAATHSRAESVAATDWQTIILLYERLYQLQPSPFTALNKAVAIFYQHGPQACLDHLAKLPQLHWLQQYYLYQALLGKVYMALGQPGKATEHYQQALVLAKNKMEQQYLHKKIAALKPPAPAPALPA
ncbi:RNA polymerase sigma factor [Pontibacter sp. SGAir0037]|uniref:RNA polymerase sigma factor n=1 Tax=Pontibacter sp. SGAir0037 TaxID=2571030 RepID=UPI0010CD2240|nr:sigma-70 family RNA polymerase sigma factor [Pontibacter sp. SGAir0037]QCR24351.1 hypothetical protein C1N53_19625 [Pontibacter sp. SGAir0037]